MSTSERNRLVIENLPLVGYLVSELCARATHLSRDDLASVGAIALITAADAFDDTRGVPFGAYARRRIVGALADELRAGDWATRGARARIRQTQAMTDTLAATLGREPTTDELAAALGVSRQEVLDGQADAARTVTTLDEHTSETLIADTALPEESLLSAEKLTYLKAAVDALPERMGLIVCRVYFEDRTVGEVAEELGITHSAVSQQRAEAVRLLRDGLQGHYADDPESVSAPVSRIGKAGRSAYLARVAEHVVANLSADGAVTRERQLVPADAARLSAV